MKKLQLDLYDAVHNRDRNRVKQLIKAGANLNYYYSHGRRVLMAAVSNSDFPMVKLLIAHGADVNQRDLFGCSALWNASTGNRLDIFIYLLNRTKNINTRFAETILMYCARCGLTQHMSELLKRNAKLDLQDFRGFTAITRAAESGEWECVDILLNAGANPKIKTQDGEDLFAICKRKGHTLTRPIPPRRTILL